MIGTKRWISPTWLGSMMRCCVSKRVLQGTYAIARSASSSQSSAHNSHGSEQAPEGGYPLEESAEPKHRQEWEGGVVKQTLEPVLSKTLMNYEAKGIYWQSASEDRIQTMAPYHCNFMGCGVRYDHMNGYFTVLNVPERPFLWKSQAQALNVQGMVRGCTDVKMSKATPVLRGGAASRDATTCTQTSADCD